MKNTQHATDTELLEDTILSATKPFGWSRQHLVRRVTASVKSDSFEWPVTPLQVMAHIDGGWRDDLRPEVLKAIADAVNDSRVTDAELLAQCAYCGREDESGEAWPSPCPSDDCPSHEPTPQDLFRDAVARELQGIHGVSPTDEEPSFSWGQCESCGTYLGGDRHAAAGILETSGEVIELDICTDCLVYHANGEEPETWRAHS